MRWYLRYGLCYRDVEELLAERGIEVDHVTVYRWVQTFTLDFIDAARPARHTISDRWFIRWARQSDRGISSDSRSSAPAGYRFPREVIAVAVRRGGPS